MTTRSRLAALATIAFVTTFAPIAARTQNAPPGTQVPLAQQCVGHWLGAGRNSPTSVAWTIDMHITSTSGSACGTIEYPSLRCGGALTNCTFRSGQLTAIEQYTHNPGTCAPDGTVVVRCSATTLRWTWVGDDVVRADLVRGP
jgi:hypothetical protein